jgi:predicted RNA-binding protein with RPS1 domain
MDIKVAGITPEIMEQALAQAKDGRIHILNEMAKALTGAADFSIHAPRIETMQIPTDKIREVIGSGGKVIREIVEVSGAKVDINDDGIIKIASPNGEAIKKAYDMIWSIVAEPEEGKVYKGKVVKLVDFGAFVNFFGKRDGLVHVSQIESRRLNHPSDVLKEGQEVWVKLLGFDDRGKVRLAMKSSTSRPAKKCIAAAKEEAEADKASAGSMSKAFETSRVSSAMIGKPTSAPPTVSMSAIHFLCSSTPSTETPITLVPRFSHSSASCATAPNSVVQTGVKSFGCENRIAQLSPIQSWKLISP